MHIEYRVSEADYRSAAQLAQRRRSTVSALDYFLPYIFAIVWIAAAILTGAADDGFQDSADLIFVLGAIPVLFGLLWRRKKALNQEYRRLVALHPLQIVNLDTDGIQIGGGKQPLRTTWKQYSRWAENKDVFILYLQQNEHHFLSIVKSHLTMLQVDELRSLLLSRLPAS